MSSQRRVNVSAAFATVAALAYLALAGAQTTKPLSEEGIVKLIDLQIGDDAIVAKLRKDGVDFNVDDAAIGRLKKAGASEAVVEGVRQAGKARQSDAPAAAKAVTYGDVLSLLRLEIAESDILKRLEKSPTIFTLDAGQVEELKRAGATEALLDAMQGRRRSPDAASEVTDLAIVLDCSGSMNDRTRDGQAKMDVARRVVSDLIRDIPDGMNLAFLVYGRDRARQCESIDVLRQLGALDSVGKSSLINSVRTLRPLGATPIALALRTAGVELAKAKGPCGLILISDGMETCQGNPAEETARLAKDLNLAFGMNVIGFDVKPDEREALEEIARAGKGKYYNAANAAEFRKAVLALHKRIDEVAAKPAAKSAPKPLDLSPAVQALIERLNDPDGWVRKTAAENLQKMRARAAVPALEKRVSDDAQQSDSFAGHAFDKEAALKALKALGPDRVVDALVAATRSNEREVRVWAVAHLGEFSGQEKAIRALIESLKDGDGWVRKVAAESLQKLGDQSAVPALEQRVSDDAQQGDSFAGRAFDKEAALKALKALGPDRVLDALVAATRSKDGTVKSWAADQLGKLGDQEKKD